MCVTTDVITHIEYNQAMMVPMFITSWTQCFRAPIGSTVWISVFIQHLWFMTKMKKLTRHGEALFCANFYTRRAVILCKASSASVMYAKVFAHRCSYHCFYVEIHPLIVLMIRSLCNRGCSDCSKKVECYTGTS